MEHQTIPWAGENHRHFCQGSDIFVLGFGKVNIAVIYKIFWLREIQKQKNELESNLTCTTIGTKKREWTAAITEVKLTGLRDYVNKDRQQSGGLRQ